MPDAILEYEGRRYRYVGTRVPRKGERYLVSHPQHAPVPVLDVNADDWGSGPVRAIFEEVRREVTFGGVVFAETGEVRAPKKGEWSIYREEAVCAGADYLSLQCPILKPVRLEAQP